MNDRYGVATLAQVYDRAERSVGDIENAENKKQAKPARKTDTMLQSGKLLEFRS